MRYLMVVLAAACIGFGAIGFFKDGDASGLVFLLAGVLLFLWALLSKRLQ